MSTTSDATTPTPTTVDVAGHRWPVDEETVRRLLRRLERERRARMRAETIAEEATRASLIDPLTSLPNRRRLLEHSDTASRSLTTDQGPTAVLFVDLDRFKSINDTWGHAVGDAALVEAAARLRRSVRPSDAVARLGGDEFVCLCRDVPTTALATKVAERVLAALEEPFRFQDGPQLSLSATIGVAVGPPGATVAELIHDADAAVGLGKSSHRGAIHLFDAGVRERTLERIHLERDLRRALQEEALEVHYQPVFDLATMRVTGVEALVRWHHETRGWVPPDTFVPVAERAGLVHDLDHVVLRRALHDLRDHGDLEVSVNLSALGLTRPGLCSDVAAVLEETGIEPHRVCLEITESAWLSRDDEVVETVLALEDLGVRMAIDDFGTGHSSLAHLQRLPVDAIKVDRSFVAGVVVRERDAIIVQAIVAMANALDLDLVAEGVETQAQRHHLLSLGVRSAQGWLLSPAVPLEQLDGLTGRG